MAQNRKIVTLTGKKHDYQDLKQIFETLTTEEKTAVIQALGLDDVLNSEGGTLNKYSLDVSSSKPTFIIKDYGVKISGDLYNFFTLDNSKVTSWQWSRDSGDMQEDLAWAVGKTTRTLDLNQTDFSERFEQRDTTFSLVAKVGTSTTLTDEITFSKFQMFSAAQIKTSGSLFLDLTPATITLSVETSAQPAGYSWFVNNELKGSSSTYLLTAQSVLPGQAATIRLELETDQGETLTDSITIPRIKNGADGQGTPGVSAYTWIKYADDENGLNMIDYPVAQNGDAKQYIGLAVNKPSPTESNDPADYKWAKYVGDEGVPGENGYMWVKYSEFSNGRKTNGEVSMFDVPFVEETVDGIPQRENLTYLGLAYNKPTKVESNVPEDYLWAKILGEDGHTPYTLDLTNDNISVPALGDGSIPNPNVAFSIAKTDVILYYGNEPIPRAEYSLVLTGTGCTYTATDANHKIQITGMTADVAEVTIKAISVGAGSKTLTTATLSLVKVKGTSIYEILPSASTIKVISVGGAAQTILPTVITTTVLVNSGTAVENTTQGRLTYRYVYASTEGTDEDGTQVGIGSSLTLSNDGDPLYIEFKYFHPVSNILVDRERVPFVRDGINGLTTEFRYAKNSDPLIPPGLTRTDKNPSGWSLALPTITGTEVAWMTKASKYQQGGDLIGQWDIPLRVTGTPGAGVPGPPGIQGTSGPIPRTFEWVAGEEYENGGAYIDYIYYRSQDANTGWYTVKIINNTLTKKIANIGIPNASLFNKEPFSPQSTFGTVIAEQANLAGFIFRNQILQSQAITSNFNKCTQMTKTVPNLTIDGLQGVINFADRMILKSDGVYLYDGCERVRLKIRWDESTGVPIIEYVGPNGETTWTPDSSEISTYVEVRAVKVSSLNVVSENVILPELQPFLCKKNLDYGLPVISTPLPLIGYGYYGSRTPDTFDVFQGMNSLGPKLASSYDGDYIINLKINNYNGGGTIKVSVKYAKILNGVLTVQHTSLPTYYTISNVQSNC